MKKKNIILILLTFVSLACQAQIKVEVSEAVELMSILSRTAGFEEYSKDMAGQYTKDTEEWFKPYQQHPIIPYYQEIRSKYGIGYEKVMNMAVHLEITKGKVKLIGDRTELNNGWQNVNLDEFITLLNKFYSDTHFRKFFEQHSSFYDEGIKDFETNIMSMFHQDWYNRFYGTEASEQFHVIIGFTYGDNNNGVHRQLEGKPKESFAIMGYWINRTTWDATLLIHEFNHSFVNPLLDNATNHAMMEKVGTKLFQFSQPAMERQAYNSWEIVINESIVRAAVYIYLKDYNLVSRGTVYFMLEEVWHKGFQWMPELVTCLRTYTTQRDKYKTLNDYYPEIAKCLAQYLNNEGNRLQNALR